VFNKLLQLLIAIVLLAMGYVLWLFQDDIQLKMAAFRTEKAVEATIATHQPKKALALLERAVTQHPQEALFHLQLATQYHQQKQPEKALMHYRIGLKLNPAARVYRFNFARLLVAQHRPNDAIREYRSVLVWAPTDVSTLHDLGQLYFDFYQQAYTRGKVTEAQWCLRWALYYFSKAIKLNKADASAWWGYGQALQLLHKESKAKQAFCKVLAQHLTFTPARYNLGLILWQEHHEPLGFELLLSAVRLKETAIAEGTSNEDIAPLQRQLATMRNEYAIRTGVVLPYKATHKAVEITHTETKKELAKTDEIAKASPLATDATVAQACQ
jgi:tetratricopeptide (TPR) repeat protein